jgi:ABC-type polysaccharide/polyol phosphate transport system ATPase subunit
VRGLGVEYDLGLTPHRTLRQTLSDLVQRKRTPPARFWALEDVTFQLPVGEALGVIGDNGSGKSTLLLALAGILEPDRGRVATFGTTSALLTLGAGFEPMLSGRENVFLAGAFLGMSRREMRERYVEIVEFADLGPFIEVPVSKYSAGMRARLGFAIASSVEPDILLLDEVLSVGDMGFRAKSEERLEELLDRAKAIVIVSHSLEFIRKTCSRALWLEHGHVAAFGLTDDVAQAYVNASPARMRADASARAQAERGGTATALDGG